ncbi:hypothetical protein JMJ58_09410 [Haloterrigena salifodinae]|uniref:Uncharacterized protein n=1 Tax=Haloterrigena salifodinae TaxID=2675099 RepID=A0A8T8E5P0_9EURY|nr:hypothetical protein [Haloterrigena salifodinae]QRV17059.1 hypothetical protein JMJ58_09410 [Haloterrigena salifodinae]
MDEYTLLIAAANTATFVTGGAVAALAYRAFRRTGSAALRAVAIGFSVIVAGSIGGAIAHVGADNVALGVAIQSSCIAVGFTILLYSLYAETTTTTTTITLDRSGSGSGSESDLEFDSNASDPRSDSESE